MGSLTTTGIVQSSATLTLSATVTDYAKWEVSSVASVRRSGGGSLISNLSIVGIGSISAYSNSTRSIRWDIGTPTGSGTNTLGVFTFGLLGNYSVSVGMSCAFNVSAVTAECIVYFELYSCTAWITATLSDGSASPLTLTSTAVALGASRAMNIPFLVSSNGGGTLTVSIRSMVDSGDGFGNVAFNAASLSMGAAGAAPARRLFNLLGIGQ